MKEWQLQPLADIALLREYIQVFWEGEKRKKGDKRKKEMQSIGGEGE